MARLLTLHPSKVTTPPTADFGLLAQVSLPAGLPVPAVIVRVTEAELPVTILLPASRTLTVIDGLKVAPCAVVLGCTLNTSL